LKARASCVTPVFLSVIAALVLVLSCVSWNCNSCGGVTSSECGDDADEVADAAAGLAMMVCLLSLRVVESQRHGG